MNRFDSSTIWKSAGEEISDGPSKSSGAEDEDPSGVSHAAPSDVEASNADPGHHAAGGGCPTAWGQSLQAQTFFVPIHYEANYRYPLIVWLHSDGYNENQVSHVMPHVSTRNYLATGIRANHAADDSGQRFSWSGGKTSLEVVERHVFEAIDRAASQYSVHAERIVLAGYQRGGTMAMRVALRHPEMFAAAVSLGGEFDIWPQLDESGKQRLRERRLPMLWQQSIETSSYDEARLIEQAKSAMEIKAMLEIRQYCNDDEMNTVVLSDLDRWVMNHVVGGAAVAKMSPWDTSPASFSDN